MAPIALFILEDDPEYFLEATPGIGSFTHLLFDLDVEYYRKRRDGKTIYYGERTKFAGLDYILDAYENLNGFSERMNTGRVAIFTGHSIDFLSEADATERAVYRNCRFISKLDRDLSGEILEWLKGK